MPDQLGAAVCGLADQGCGGGGSWAVLNLFGEGFDRAGDDREHVVEIMRDTARELADRVELLRLIQQSLGLMRHRDVVIDHRRPGDGAGGVDRKSTRLNSS